MEKFKLDQFQKEAIETAHSGSSVIVSAPTGAGKTLIAEYIIEDCEDIEEFREALELAIQEYEIIYYNNAMEVLTEDDPSLRTSLDLASEMGYQTDQINSELLATLLTQSMMTDELDSFVELFK